MQKLGYCITVLEIMERFIKPWGKKERKEKGKKNANYGKPYQFQEIV